MRLSTTIFSLLLLAGCAQNDVIGCPEVKPWTPQDQNKLFAETEPPFETQYPTVWRALNEWQDMRVTAKPCALLSRPIPE
jgi:hypothetical protein